MPKIFNGLLPIILLLCQWTTHAQRAVTTGDFKQRTVATGLSGPWEITMGPDQMLWTTESHGYRVSRIDPVSGSKQVLLDLQDQKDFPRYDLIPDSIDGGKKWPQAGLMGLALHPLLLQGKPFVYLVYIASFEGRGSHGDGMQPDDGGVFFRTRLTRYTYDRERGMLHSPVVILDSIPGSNDHNGGRLMIAPSNGVFHLYYSIGDMGAGQFVNGGRRNYAQDPASYEGKILRLNLEPDPGAAGNGWIPRDNPFGNAVYSIGHRNPQGLAFSQYHGITRIFSCEHGPFSDDEVNLVMAGENYGHPLVIGPADGNYDGLAAGVSSNPRLPGQWHTSYPQIVSEAAARDSLHLRDPIWSFEPTPQTELYPLFEAIRKNDPEQPRWRSEAPSSLDVYHGGIPGWDGSLLITTLKTGRVMRLTLDEQGTRIINKPEQLFKAPLRYRDLAFSADGRSIYLAVDSAEISSGPTEEIPGRSRQLGVIIEYRYAGAGFADVSQSNSMDKKETSTTPAGNTPVPGAGATKDARLSASNDMDKDPDLQPDPEEDLDEGELARKDNSND